MKLYLRKVMLFILLVNIYNVLAFNRDIILKEIGEKKYEMIKAKSNLPQHGECWHNALKSIKNNCENLNDHEHSILALKLANCFLHDSGHSMYNCHLHITEDERRECIKNMPDRAFGVYKEFYTHTTHICFFLNQEIWQTETKNTIKSLYETSSRMKQQLLEASEMQSVMLQSQKEGLQIQSELLNNGKELSGVIKSSAETVNDMVIDFKESAKDQKELLYEIFSYMRTFQTWVIGEVSWFQSIVYYIVSCILCALFSSSKRTAEARITLFMVLSLNVVIERMLVQYYDNTTPHATDEKIKLIQTTWLCRKGALVICVFILFCTYYLYKDENTENSKMLKRIEQQLSTIQTIHTPSNLDQTVRYSKRLALKRLQISSYTEDAKDFDKLK